MMVYLETLLFLLCSLTISVGQLSLSSPCPRVFNYQSDGRDWFGVITVPSPGVGQAMRLNLKMSIKTKLPTKYVGRIEPLGEQSELLNRLLGGLSFEYKVYFPLSNPIPKVTEIKFNGAIICAGPPETFTGPGQFVTSINLDHVLSIENPGQQQTQQHLLYTTQRPDYFQPDPNNLEKPASQFFTNEQAINSRPQGQTDNQYNYFFEPQTQTDNTYNSKPQVPTNNIYNTRPNTYNPRPSIQTEKPPIDFTNNNQYKPFSSVDFSIFDDSDGDRPNQNSFARPNQQTTTPAPQYPTVNQQPQDLSGDLQSICGKPRNGFVPLIFGGDSTERGDWPWVVAMFKKNTNGLTFICSGSLVSNKHVVTAGHCLHERRRQFRTDDLILKVGAHNIQDWTDEQAKTTRVEKIHLHEEYDKMSLKNDIAVLLIQPIVFTNYILPICIWQGSDNLERVIGKRATVVGWGKDERGLVVTPEPRQAQVPIVSTEECRASKQNFIEITSDKTLCAGDKDGIGPCSGDSGGGLFLNQFNKWMLRGIVSLSLRAANTNECDLSEYVVYTDAAKYSSWIRQVMDER